MKLAAMNGRMGPFRQIEERNQAKPNPRGFPETQIGERRMLEIVRA